MLTFLLLYICGEYCVQVGFCDAVYVVCVHQTICHQCSVKARSAHWQGKRHILKTNSGLRYLGCIYVFVSVDMIYTTLMGRNAHTGNQAPVISMEGLHDAITLCVHIYIPGSLL